MKKTQIPVEKIDAFMDEVSLSMRKFVDFNNFLKENIEVLLEYGTQKEIYACLQKHEIKVCSYATFVAHFKKIKAEYESRMRYARENIQKKKEKKLVESSGLEIQK